ncbi:MULTISPECIES: hypothetical protein [unclassified Agarivorans]|uniref:hypothetical protein n=1 Tax=unclassified Agarivorans TaxID=2636026 RepID=UPI0026E39143|nr:MULTISPECIES: hypothetical protein [unclassified Agarivorans]MDO6687456.1 hypothetical protein [Agarivorans sp. 3_MG-2023]MDO6715222.1 hypothetical protein [Agarivorans sp. 2_MG-2023]
MQQYKGWLFLASLLLYLLYAFEVIGVGLATVVTWAAALAYLPQLSRAIRIQAGCLLSIGIVLLLLAASQNTLLSPIDVLSINLPLLAMFSAVSFLALANPENQQDPLPTGKRSIASTAVGVNVLGAIINLSIIFIVGDRLAKQKQLTNAQQKVLMRCFCAAAWWSPFFIATAVSITYAPGMQWLDVLLPGALMALIALIFTTAEVSLREKDNFAGYPLRRESLTIPFVLAVTVIGLHFAFPDFSIILMITCLAPIAALTFAKGKSKVIIARQFITHRLSNVGSQYVLFLAAGVFSAGIKALLLAYPETLSLHNIEFSHQTFAVVLALMIVACMFGIHPVISISLASPLLLPLNPEPSQLGFLFLSSWAISTGSSPLSGVGLTMIGRYQFSTSQILKNNWYYALSMWLICSAVNALLM